jgi:hypothetical protein
MTYETAMTTRSAIADIQRSGASRTTYVSAKPTAAIASTRGGPSMRTRGRRGSRGRRRGFDPPVASSTIACVTLAISLSAHQWTRCTVWFVCVNCVTSDLFWWVDGAVGPARLVGMDSPRMLAAATLAILAAVALLLVLLVSRT